MTSRHKKEVLININYQFNNTMRKDLTKRKQQALQSHQLIFDTASTLFKKKGYDQTTVGDICRKAGISTGAFYHHFKSKDQVIAEEYLKIDAFCKETFNAFPAGMSAVEKLSIFTRRMSQYIAELGVTLLKAVYYSEIGPKKKKKFLLDEKRPIFKIYKQLVHEAQEKGEIRTDLDETMIVDIIIKCSRGNIYEWVLRNGNFDYVEASQQILALFLSGLLPRETIKGKSIQAR